MTKATAYLATVHLLVDANDAQGAADALYSLLTERGINHAGSRLLDWSFRQRAERILCPRPVRYSPELKPFLLALAKLRHPRQGDAR